MCFIYFILFYFSFFLNDLEINRTKNTKNSYLGNLATYFMPNNNQSNANHNDSCKYPSLLNGCHRLINYVYFRIKCVYVVS